MSKAFLTKPNSPTSHLIGKVQNVHWDHKEATIRELVKEGVPLRVAELAMIDMRGYLFSAQRNKLTPKQAAGIMFEEIERMYKAGPVWHYTPEMDNAPVAQ